MLALSLLPWHLWNVSVQIEEALVGGVEGVWPDHHPKIHHHHKELGREDGAAVSGLSLTAIMKPVGSIVHMHECLKM